MDSTNCTIQYYTFEEISELGFSQEDRPNEDVTVDDYLIYDIVFKEMSEVKTKDFEANNVVRKKSRFILCERLHNWSIRKTLRTNNQRTDKVYIHKDTNIQFRSMIEVDDFINSGLYPKRPTKKQMKEKEHLDSSSNKKRSPRRKLDWSFDITRFLDDNSPVYHIKFHDAEHVMNICFSESEREF